MVGEYGPSVVRYLPQLSVSSKVCQTQAWYGVFVVEIKKDESHVGVTLLSNPRAGFQAPAELGRQDEARRIYKH